MVTKARRHTLKRVLAAIKPTLESNGFNDENALFSKRLNKNWIIVEFQQDDRSPSHLLIFTVNRGIVSQRVHSFFDPDFDEQQDVDLGDACWRERIGLLVERQDIWWTLSTDDDVASVAVELNQYLQELALPMLDEVSSDERLRDIWRSNRSPGITDFSD